MNSHSQFQQYGRPWTFPTHKVLLDESSDKLRIRITDLAKAQLALSSRPVEGVRIRIISIFSNRTIAPLSITPSLLERVLTEYDVGPDFADVVACFGQEPNIAEGSSNNAALQIDDEGCSVLSYQVRSVEQNGRGAQNSWSRRHTGVYHCHKASSGLDVMIVLHPGREPRFETAVASLRTDKARREEVCKDPLRLHENLLASSTDNWRWYMRYLGEQVDKANDLAMVITPERTEPMSSFVRVQELRHANDLIHFARACCAGNLDLLERLSQLPLHANKSMSSLATSQAKLRGFIESADVLKGRVQNLIDLVGYTLTLHNQLESAKVEKELRDLTESLNRLTQDTVDDSATVKIITFVSAVYLPGSFIATLLGMNLFVFDTTTGKLRVSPDFWIFIAVWLPLTLITGGLYAFIKSRTKRDAIKRGARSHKRFHSSGTIA
ncbi:hypothetical protein EJ07DRAFT_131126 [Lizonia empirigonia]|nr:hypothetical protein EJ07DRAFT_131126 [Lizonia empirigonia]